MRFVIPVLILLASSFWALVPLADAQGAGAFGVAPTDLKFGAAVRDEPLQRMLSIQNGKDEPVRVELRADAEPGTWAIGGMGNLTIPARSARELPLRMVVPRDAPNGEYRGPIYVHFLPGGQVSQGQSGATFAFAVRVNLSVDVGGDQRIGFQAGGLFVPDAEETTSPSFSWVVKNTGNVRASPDVHVQVRRTDGEPVFDADVTSAPIVPGSEENLTFALDARLPRGQYVLSATLAGPGGATEEAWFEVLETGALRRSGVLGGLRLIDLGSRQETHRIAFGNDVELSAGFTNTGELVVAARLQGYLAQGGKVLREFTSQEVMVSPGETVDLKVMLRDLPRAGQYDVRAEASFSGKLTPARDAVLILEDAAPKAGTPAVGGPMAALVLAAVAALLARGRGRKPGG